MARQVQPLRIAKGNAPPSSPSKMASNRPLSEVGPTSQRRNSPSYNQATKKAIISREPSPFTENSPPQSFVKSSPRDFWHGKSPMSPSRLDVDASRERSLSPLPSSPKRRPSVERLMQASRVKNSNIFALEHKDAYDPTSVPIVERPSANRPLSQSFANNTFARADSQRKENTPFRSPDRLGHKRNQSEMNVPFLSPTHQAASVPLPSSPEKQGSPSPTKSSLARSSMFGGHDADMSSFSDVDERTPPTPRALHRHAKSVTFHEEPPVINEYEQQTPEPSVSVASDREGSWDSDDFADQDISFDRGSPADPDHDDSFDDDLENADKTPVVLPEDWSRMSPDEARTDLVNDEDDVFDDETTERINFDRAGSVTSDGEGRPLPPLPGFMRRDRRNSSGIADAAERASLAHRSLPLPPQRASCSKEEVLNMNRRSSLSIEDRLALMNGASQSGDNERPTSKSSEGGAHNQEGELVITNLDTGEKMEVRVREEEVDEDSAADLSEFTQAPPRISRESILRRVRNSKYDFEDDDDADESELPGDGDGQARPSIAELARMHPDQPVPSRETTRETSDNCIDPAAAAYILDQDEDVQIKQEPTDDDDFDMNSIPVAHQATPRSPSRMDDYERQSSVLRHDLRDFSDDDEEGEHGDASRESSLGPDAESSMIHTKPQTMEHEDGKETLQDAMQLLTMKDYSEPSTHNESTEQRRGGFMGLPAYLAADDYGLGMQEYISPTPPASNETTQQKLETTKMPELQPPNLSQKEYGVSEVPHVERDVSPPATPDSVIRVSADREISPIEELSTLPQEEVKQEAPAIPERQATIKTGGRLKTRPSATPVDFAALTEQHRLEGADYPVPAIPQEYQIETEGDSSRTEEASVYSSEGNESKSDSLVERDHEPKARRKSRKSGGKIDLMLDTSNFSLGDNEGLGLDHEFDRVIESQKKGYHTRESNKIVVASNRNVSGDSTDSNETAKSNDAQPMSPTADPQPRPPSRGTNSANSSPRKPSEHYLKTEPWNGKTRRKSTRVASGQKAHRSEPAPPLPGQESALGIVDEDYSLANLDDGTLDGVERGRLFVKVVGVKDLDIPVPSNDRIYFQLTLDNGLHCVTTSDMELGNTAPIGQEFELVVLNDLEFQLTLTTNLPPPPSVPTATRPTSSSKSPTKSKVTGFSRFLSSPKKRAEKEKMEREAAEAEEQRIRNEEQRKRASVQPTVWDLLRDLVNAQDGSFARAYVNLKAHEKKCFGRQLTVDVPCYNEWALEKDSHVINSVRSKRGNNTGPIRRPPYVVGYLQLQLLYVPKPKDATDEDMPKSMSGAVREMNKASEVKEVVHESHLSQQGGDCIHWRRRFFRLQGPKLTAYHEHTHQKRAVINLSKASRLVDDKSMLVADPTSAKPGSKNRRKSAFAEEDEGYQYVEEGFRIRFSNGETIDFYAESRAQKDEWMEVLSQVIGKPDVVPHAARWTDLVLAREKAENNSTGPAMPPSSPRKGGGGTDMRDFAAKAPSNGLARATSHRKPVVPPASSKLSSKSAPNSPLKSTLPSPQKPALSVARPRTPPLQPRTGHRSRDAVKSMIF